VICANCGKAATYGARGWRAYLCEELSPSPPELEFWCAVCAAHEFGFTHRGRPLDDWMPDELLDRPRRAV
jgi:hypothetical protein